MTGKGYGAYHEEYNKPLEITNFFKNSLSVSDIQDRMILFVPIKCERYYHLTNTPQLNVFNRNYMRELVNAVSFGYQELILYLRSTQALASSCTIAITPILSAGGIDFVRFRKDEKTGRMVALYQEPEFLDPRERGYSPRFCEQPMVYALTYILVQAQLNMKVKNPLFQVSNNVISGRSQNEVQVALNTLRQKLKRSSGLYAQDGLFHHSESPWYLTMEVYFYGSYAMSQKGFYFSRLEEGRLKEVTELPPVVNQFFSYDAFWLIWQDLDHENWLFPQATNTFFGVRNLRGIIDDREAYMNLAILGSIEEQASIARIAMHWFCHYHQLEQDFFACLSFDEGMCFQIDAPRFFRLFQAELEQTSAFLVNAHRLALEV